MANENRLIRPGDLIATLRDDPDINGKNFARVKRHIENAPTVDAVEVVHGRWEQCFEDWRKQIEGDKCSACGFEHYGCCIKYYHYCPNCGAKMEGGNEE